MALGLLRTLAADTDVRIRTAAAAALAKSVMPARGRRSPSSPVRVILPPRPHSLRPGNPGLTALQRFVECPIGAKSDADRDAGRPWRADPSSDRRAHEGPQPLNRAAAARSIATASLPDASEYLKRLAADFDIFGRTSAKLALAKLGDPDAIKEAHALLTGEVPDLQLLAAEILIDHAPEQVVHALLPLLQNRDGLIRFQAAAIVGRTDPAAVREILLAGLSDENPVVQEEAARVLGQVLPTELAELRKLMRHRNRFVVVRACSAVAG